MRAWRVVQLRHESSALDGDGARLYGGRWNPPGLPMVYAAESAAVAVLEVRVNLAAPPPHPYVALRLEVSDEALRSVAVDELPPDWQRSPIPRAPRVFGGAWLASGETVGLRVPSAVLPIESTILLNPSHPDFDAAVRLVHREPIMLDRRLF